MPQSHRTGPRPLLFLAAVVGLLLGAGCSVVKKDEPVEHAPQACCTEADSQLQHFKGCSVRRRNCRRQERWWMRGYVTCTAVDQANCAGGRCCEYRPQYDPDVGKPKADDEAAEDVADDATTPTDAEATEAEATEAEATQPEATEADAASEPPAPEADGEDPEAPLP